MCMAVYLTNGQNNDELNERKYQRAQSLGKTSVVIVLATLGFVETFRYDNAIIIMLIPVLFMATIDSLIKVIFKKTDKTKIYFLWIQAIILIVTIIVYILKTWLQL